MNTNIFKKVISLACLFALQPVKVVHAYDIPAKFYGLNNTFNFSQTPTSKDGILLKYDYLSRDDVYKLPGSDDENNRYLVSRPMSSHLLSLSKWINDENYLALRGTSTMSPHSTANQLSDVYLLLGRHRHYWTQYFSLSTSSGDHSRNVGARGVAFQLGLEKHSRPSRSKYYYGGDIKYSHGDQLILPSPFNAIDANILVLGRVGWSFEILNDFFSGFEGMIEKSATSSFVQQTVSYNMSKKWSRFNVNASYGIESLLGFSNEKRVLLNLSYLFDDQKVFKQQVSPPVSTELTHFPFNNFKPKDDSKSIIINVAGKSEEHFEDPVMCGSNQHLSKIFSLASGTIHFGVNSKKVEEKYYALLGTIVRILNNFGPQISRFYVMGNAKKLKNGMTGQKLSQARAESVIELLKEFGANPKIIKSLPAGQYQHTEEHALNEKRKVDFLVDFQESRICRGLGIATSEFTNFQIEQVLEKIKSNRNEKIVIYGGDVETYKLEEILNLKDIHVTIFPTYRKDFTGKILLVDFGLRKID